VLESGLCGAGADGATDNMRSAVRRTRSSRLVSPDPEHGARAMFGNGGGVPVDVRILRDAG
jgi:hypothetical protein